VQFVHREFAAKYLKLKVSFKLQNPQGKQWDVSCISNDKRSSSMRIAKGLPGFARENNLLKKHIYEFQLIKMKPVVVLLVTSSHLVKNCFRFAYSSVLFLFYFLHFFLRPKSLDLLYFFITHFFLRAHLFFSLCVFFNVKRLLAPKQ
jgi:hypothetical protein